ncbi:MAG: tryptophan-rich sensory protein [Clostridiales bacterium]|nr:tryptophan-rich sensory protein [Clostridiales bacterium]
MKKGNIISTLSIIIVAVIGTIFTQIGMSWFDSLTKPTEWIPSFIIPIVWTVIYLAFAIILIKWQNKTELTKENIILLVINGVLNILWCLVFFTLNQLFIGNVIIIINALFAIRLIFEIAKEDAMYGLILSIYPIWLCIATSLNTALWILN